MKKIMNFIPSDDSLFLTDKERSTFKKAKDGLRAGLTALFVPVLLGIANHHMIAKKEQKLHVTSDILMRDSKDLDALEKEKEASNDPLRQSELKNKIGAKQEDVYRDWETGKGLSGELSAMKLQGDIAEKAFLGGVSAGTGAMALRARLRRRARTDKAKEFEK